MRNDVAPGEPITFTSAFERALRSSPELAAAEQGSIAAAVALRQAGALTMSRSNWSATVRPGVQRTWIWISGIILMDTAWRTWRTITHNQTIGPRSAYFGRRDVHLRSAEYYGILTTQNGRWLNTQQ